MELVGTHECIFLEWKKRGARYRRKAQWTRVGVGRKRDEKTKEEEEEAAEAGRKAGEEEVDVELKEVGRVLCLLRSLTKVQLPVDACFVLPHTAGASTRVLLMPQPSSLVVLANV
eukprot:evm.model.NODE_32765_length_12168_cov_16.377300.1